MAEAVGRGLDWMAAHPNRVAFLGALDVAAAGGRDREACEPTLRPMAVFAPDALGTVHPATTSLLLASLRFSQAVAEFGRSRDWAVGVIADHAHTVWRSTGLLQAA